MSSEIYNRDYSECALKGNSFVLDQSAIERVLITNLQLFPHMRVLEIGCDTGSVQDSIEKISPNTIGIDINDYAIKQNKCAQSFVMDGTNMTFTDNTFDRTYSSHTIEHIEDLNKHLSEIARVLKPGGLYVAVYPWEPIRGFAALRAALTLYKNPLKARDMHLHKLYPSKINELISNLPLTQIHHSLHFMYSPQWVSVLKKESS